MFVIVLVAWGEIDEFHGDRTYKFIRNVNDYKILSGKKYAPFYRALSAHQNAA